MLQGRFEAIISEFPHLKPILVVGDVGVDKYTYGEVTRISPEAPVPVLEVKKEWIKLGLAANVSDNLCALSVPNTLCSLIGRDRNGESFYSLLDEKGISKNHIYAVEGIHTTWKERVTTKGQQICRIDYETQGEIDRELADKIAQNCRRLAQTHAALIIEDYGKGLITQALAAQLIEAFRQENKIVAVDPSRKTSPLYYQGATLLKPNKDEARLMAQALGHTDRSIESIAYFLLERLNLEKVVITLGAEGMALLDRAGRVPFTVIPTFAREVYDVSGAGDTAISAITASLLANATLAEACWVGNLASSVVVAKMGTATVTLDELSRFYRENIVNFS